MRMNLLGKMIQSLKSQSSIDADARVKIQEVVALPFDEVKRHALELLADTRRFRCVKSIQSHNPSIDRLGSILQEFFARFESVAETKGDFFVGRQAVGDSTLRPGFIKIGTDFAYSELVVRPGEDRVSIVTDGEHVLDGLPTIYHSIYLLG